MSCIPGISMLMGINIVWTPPRLSMLANVINGTGDQYKGMQTIWQTIPSQDK